MADGLQDFFCECFWLSWHSSWPDIRLFSIGQAYLRSADAEIKANNKFSKQESLINFIKFRVSL